MQLIRSDFREIRPWEFSLQRTVQFSLARTNDETISMVKTIAGNKLQILNLSDVMPCLKKKFDKKMNRQRSISMEFEQLPCK